MWIPAQALIVGFAAGLADYSLAIGYDLIAVPLLIILGIDPRKAIATALLSQVLAGIAYGAYRRKAMATRTELTTILSASASAFLFSLTALSLSPNATRIVLAGLLLLFVFTAIAQVHNSIDPPRTPDRRCLMLVALAAGAVKGIVGSGFSAIMMLGQLILGVEVSRAVATTIVSKVLPGLLALVPRAASGFLDPLLAIAVLGGSLLSIPLASKLASSIPRKVAYIAVCAYAVVTAILLLIDVIRELDLATWWGIT